MSDGRSCSLLHSSLINFHQLIPFSFSNIHNNPHKLIAIETRIRPCLSLVTFCMPAASRMIHMGAASKR